MSCCLRASDCDKIACGLRDQSEVNTGAEACDSVRLSMCSPADETLIGSAASRFGASHLTWRACETYCPLNQNMSDGLLLLSII